MIGGAGFIGSHTADELSRRGYSVTVIDRKASPWVKKEQKMVVGDMMDISLLRETIRGAKYVYHFGGLADIEEAKKRPLDAVQQNVVGTMKILSTAAEENIERLIYASTIYVYGPYGSFYRATKQAAEILIETCYEEYSLDYSILRYGSLYGPRSQSWNGLRGYVSEIIRTGGINYHGNGKERREYIHVQDAARLSVDILDDVHKNQVVTVTGQQILSSKELIEMIVEISGARGTVSYSNETKRSEHYTITPYRYTPKRSKKIVPDKFIDIGEGILELVEELHNEMSND